MRVLPLILVLSLAIVLDVAFAADAPTERVATAGPRATPAGHTFIAPEGFTLTRGEHAVTLTPPENDTTITIVDVDAASAEEAVSKGWAVARPGFDRKLKLSTPRPPRNGWTDQRVFDYETSPNEKANVFAVARRSTVGAPNTWVAVLVDATEATLEKSAVRRWARC